MTECVINKELLSRTVPIINNYIRQKESELTLKREELNDLPVRYKITETIKEEIATLTEEVNSMKKLVQSINDQ